MVNIGIIGLGGIAGAHIPAYDALPNARLVARCDRDPARAAGTAGGVAINLGAGDTGTAAARACTDYRELLRDPEVEAVDICLPTDLHPEVAVAALEAGKHVLCEKPMALTVAECDRMIAAAEASGRILMIAHCIRFWPEYAALKALVESGQYGRVTYAMFRRLSPLPDWSAGDWMLDPGRSGGSILDLHIHDADFVAYLLGMPRKVFAVGLQDATGISQLIAEYIYDEPRLILAEGGNCYPKGFPFRMTFLVHLDGASVEWDGARGPLTVYPEGGEPYTPPLPEGTGYTREIAYFLDCVERNAQPTLVSAFDARETIRLIQAEVASLHSGQPVELAGFAG
ncbi:MAG: Gfo/Idh/MocA family protein [Armatimonadota bacterium]